MADSRIYDVPVTLSDGKARTLRYTLGSLRRLKDRGVDFLQLPESEVLDHLHEFLWAGLAWEDKTLTPESVADLVPLAETEAVMKLVFQAFDKSKTPETPPDPMPPASEQVPAMT